MNIRITKYGNRNWAVWTGDDLLAVTVYKKGARAIRDLLVRHGLGTTAENSRASDMAVFWPHGSREIVR